MIKGLLPIFMSSAGVATVGVVSYVTLSEPQPAAPEPEQPAIVSQEPVPKPQEVAKLQVPEVEADVAILPSFSVLRVEPDGSGVIAGQGEPLQLLQLFDGEILIAETKTGPSGDFAIVLDKPLAPGLHQLTLRTIGPDGTVLVSEQAGLVDVPLPNNPTALTVLVTEPGEASRVIAKPIVPEPEAPEPVVPEVKVATVSPELPDAPEAPEVPEVKPAKSVKPVLIGAVETENGQLFIAGEAEPGSIVNFYLGSDYLGQATVAENGAFLFEAKREIEAGAFEIRADMMLEPETDVVSRAAVDVLHETQVAVADPVVEPDPEVVQEVAAEPAKPQLRTGAAVIIRRGDSLWQVARRNYGAGYRFTTIFEANRDQVRNPDLIYPGQVLKVPEKNSDG